MQIGSLTFQMAADVAALRRDMDQATRMVNSGAASIQRAASMAGAALGAIGVGLSVGALTGWVKSAIDAADKFDEMSSRIGISARELSSLQLAFAQAGVPVDKMGDMLAKLQKEMAGGNDGLKALGVQTRAADGSLRSTTDVLMDVSGQFAGIRDGAGKTALAMEIFGKSGADMVPLLNGGSDGIRDMITQAERLGIVLDDETAAAAGRFNDSLEMIGMGMGGVGQQLAAQLLPTLNSLAGSFLETMTQGGGVTKMAGVLSTAFKGLYSAGAFVTQVFSAAGTSLGGFGASIAAVLRGDFTQAVEINRQARSDVQAGWSSFGVSMTKLWDDSAGSGIAAMSGVGAASKREAPHIAAAGKAAGEGWQAGREAAQEWAKAFSDFAKMAEDAESKSLGLSKAQARLLQYLASPAYAEHTEQMRALVLAEAYAVIGAEQLAEAEQAAAKWAEEAATANASHVESMQAQTTKLQEQLATQREANAAVGMSEQAQAALTVARLLDAAAIAQQRAAWADSSMLGTEVVAQYTAQAQALRDLAAAKAEAAALAQAERDKQTVQQFSTAGASTDFSAGFDRSSAALGVFLQQFGKLVDIQAEYDAARKAAGSDTVQLAKVEAANLARQVNAYGNLIGAAKGYFKEGSTGYKVLGAAEKAFRATELALAIKSAAQKLGLIEGITVAKVAGDAQQAASATASVGPEVAAAMAKGQANATAAVANQGNGDPYSAFFRIAAMVALMAGLGFAVRGGGGGGGDPTAGRQAANGTGTVLGDASAKSESLAKSIELLADVDTMTMRYSAQMLASLRNIEASMAGVSVQILRAGGITTGDNLGIQTGTLAVNQGDPIFNAIGLPGLDKLNDTVLNIPVLGEFVGKLQSMWSKTTATIVDAGLSINGTTSQLLAGDGVQQYADIQYKKDRKIGRDKTWTETRMQDVGADITRQFGLIFQEVGTVLQGAASSLGLDAQRVAEQVAGYVVDIPRLSLEGLSGDALQEALSAAVGAQADTIAKQVLPAIAAFQQVGEGYFETIARVSAGVETGRAALRGLGVQAIAYADIANKQADVSTELVRQSLIAAETTATYATELRRVPAGLRAFVGGARDVMVTTITETVSSIGEIISTLDGSAEELAAAYSGLTDARQSLQLLGLDGDAISRDMISGAGGLDALQDALATFEESFLSDSERLGNQTARMSTQFARLGLALPATSADFVALVRGLDTTSGAGQELLGQVLALSQGFADLQSARDDAAGTSGTAAVRSAADIASERANLEKQLLQVQGDTAALRALELDGLDESNRALQRRIWALQDEAKRTQDLAAAGKGIAAYIQELQGKAGAAASMSQLRANYQGTLTAAQGGDVVASGQIVADAKALLERVKSTASDPLAYARESARIATQLQALPATVSYAEQQAQALAAVQGSTAAMADAVQPLQPLLERIAAATEAANAAGPGAAPSSPVSTLPAPTEVAAPIVTPVPVGAGGPDMTSGIVGAPVILPGDPYSQDLPTGLDAAAKVAKAAMQSAADAESIKQAGGAGGSSSGIRRIAAFASGGDFGGGLRLVGEEGPELEVTGPSRIYSAGQTADLLSSAGAGGSQVVAELQASRAELQALRAELAALRDDQQRQAAAIAGGVQTTARILTRITPDGDALATREAAAI